MSVNLLRYDEAGTPSKQSGGSMTAIRRSELASEGCRMRLGQPGVVAVVDDGGWPILIERMDHAAYDASVEVRAPDVAQP